MITGGRIILLSSSAISSSSYRTDKTDKTDKNEKYGHNPLIKERERLSVYGTDEELSLYSKLNVSLSNSLKCSGTDVQGKIEEDRLKERNLIIDIINLSEKCLLNKICVDIFFLQEDRLLSNKFKKKEDNLKFKDIAILSECSDRTGGHTHYITGNMNINENCYRLNEELNESILSFYSADVTIKLRTNKGIKMHNYYGVGNIEPLLDEVNYSGINSETTFCFTLRHDNNTIIKDEDKCHIQLAILYTDINMRRLVRVLNLNLIASTSPSVIFRHADLDCVITTITKIAVEKALNYPLSLKNNVPITGLAVLTEHTPCRDWLVSTAANVLKQYRKHCSPHSPRGQLILPEPLKLLPLYTLGLLKHAAFVENFPLPRKLVMGPLVLANVQRLCVRASERAYELRRLRSLSVRSTVFTIYPRFYSFRHCDDDETNENENTTSNNNQSDSGSGPSSHNGIGNNTNDIVNNNNNNNSSNNNNNNSSNNNDNNNNSSNDNNSSNNNNDNNNGMINKNTYSDLGLYLSSNFSTTSSTVNGTESPVPAATTMQTYSPVENLGPESVSIILPPPLAVTSEAIESDGIYLLDDGVIMWFIIGKNIPIEWLKDLFIGMDIPLSNSNRPQCIEFLVGNKSNNLGHIAENIKKVVDVSRQISSSKQGNIIKYNTFLYYYNFIIFLILFYCKLIVVLIKF